jgi:SAM-dependent methyltransferase
MRISRKVANNLIEQFMHPRGAIGSLVGWEMAVRPSNRKRNKWAVSLMDIEPEDRVLEIGFGPGIAIREMASRATRGHVVGIDQSGVMRRQALRRNAAADRSGRVTLVEASVDNMPVFDDAFDKFLAVNNMGFWNHPRTRLKEITKCLRDAGLIAIVSQPRMPGANAETTANEAKTIVALLASVGCVAIRVETLDLSPPVACVIGYVRHANNRSSTPIPKAVE